MSNDHYIHDLEEGMQEDQFYAEVMEELYSDSVKALRECVAKGLSQESINHLVYITGVNRKDIQ